MKNNLTISSSFQRSPLISAFFYPGSPIVLSIPMATKKRDILDNPLTKEMLHEDSRFPPPFIQMPDSCSAFISVAFALSFDCPYWYPFLNGSSFQNFPALTKKTIAKACQVELTVHLPAILLFTQLVFFLTRTIASMAIGILIPSFVFPRGCGIEKV